MPRHNQLCNLDYLFCLIFVTVSVYRAFYNYKEGKLETKLSLKVNKTVVGKCLVILYSSANQYIDLSIDMAVNWR